MTDTCETVVVVRKDHPEGKVEINKSDMAKDDVEYSAPKPKASPKKKK